MTCVFQAPNTDSPLALESTIALVQGAAVLAVWLGEEGAMVYCDTSRRCLFWRELSNESPPRVLQLDHGPICSLFSAGDGRIVGLSTDGNLLFMHSKRGKVAKTVPCPRPAGNAAVARLEHWPANNAVAFPGEDGHLAVCRLDSLQVSTVSAHAGGFFVVAGPDGSLLTVGKDDGVIRVWPAPGKPSSKSIGCPRETLCGRFMPGGSDSLVLIGQDGQGRLFRIADGCLHLVRRLGPLAFRTVASASSRDRQRLEDEHRQQAALGVGQQIREKIDAGETSDIDHLHQHLVETGFPLLSCGLRVEQAVREQDPLAPEQA
jgi:WD40 repeat protein